jgi:hypothetical protein
MHVHTMDPSHDGSVVVDIGGNVGALVLYTGAEQLGVEIDVEALGEPGSRTHVAVRERHVGGATTFAAVYPALVAGDYVLHLPGAPRIVAITGGSIAEVVWT